MSERQRTEPEPGSRPALGDRERRTDGPVDQSTPMLTVVNCADSAMPGWRFLEPELTARGHPARWVFHSGDPQNRLEELIGRPNLARFRACWRAAGDAKRSERTVVITHLPRTSCWVAVFCWMRRAAVEHVAFSFNFTEMPGPMLRWIMRRAFRRVDRFVVFSDVERDLYASYFGLPIDRFDFLPWAMEQPTPEPDQPVIEGPYVSVVGSEGRDLDTLFRAARTLPSVPFVVVTRQTIAGSVPSNVTVLGSLPAERCWNIIKFSRASVVPLVSERTNCGHITVVASHLLGRPVVVTRTISLQDYVQAGVDGLMVEAGDADQLRDEIDLLWRDPERAEEMGSQAARSAAATYSTDRWVEYVAGILSEASG